MSFDFKHRFRSRSDRHDLDWHSFFSPRGSDGRGRRGRPHHHGPHDHHGHHGHDHHPRGHGRFERGEGEHFAMKRLLAHGDLRYVVLLLIEEKPRHGYELIKLIESKSSGQYAPSPGVIYPTLTYLEETGLVTTTVQSDKKQYSITPEGVEHLNQNRNMAVGILQRLEEIGAQMAAARAESETEEDFAEMRQVFHDLRHELRAAVTGPAEKKKKVFALLQQTLVELRKIIKGES